MMMTPNPSKLSLRQASLRVVASIALGGAIAFAIASHGSASAARVETVPPGTAASQLGVLKTGHVEANPPSGVSGGFDGASADIGGVRLLGSNAGGKGLSLYGTARANGGACNSLITAKEAVGTVCVSSIPADGVTLSASDADGWVIYGFAADDVTGVDVVLNGKTQPAQLLQNAYAADLGDGSLSDATELLVHHADGSTDAVKNTLRAPGS